MDHVRDTLCVQFLIFCINQNKFIRATLNVNFVWLSHCYLLNMSELKRVWLSRTAHRKPKIKREEIKKNFGFFERYSKKIMKF